MLISSEILLYPFRSLKWKEVFIIGGALGFIGMFMPLIIALFPAFGVRAMRQTIRGDQPSLPTWNDFGQLIKDTLWFVLVMLVYLLPSILIAGTAILFFFLAFMIAPATLIGAGRNSGEAFGFIFISGWSIYMLGIMISSAISLPLQFLAFVALTRAVAHDNLRQAFDLRVVWQLTRTNFLNFAVSFATAYGLYYVLTIMAGIAIYSLICTPIYYPLLAIGMMYVSMVGSAMYGLAYRNAQSRFAMAGVIA